ncbi:MULTISPECIES: hypothetical protein [unclassified Schlesneria]|uniref:hypothetical protein n=1 Tax=Schlesneria TaxID=656899 RepID=UPI002F033985
MDCYLTVYEQLTWPRQMAEECVRLGLSPVILDHGSTYPPLLKWLDECPYPVIRVAHNAGCYGFWWTGRYREMSSQYIVSDSDLDLSQVPDDVVERLQQALAENPDVAKAGLSLEIEDIPDTYPFREQVMVWERPYWTEKRSGAWRANIGATFALYDPARHEMLDEDFYSAVRLDRPYTARHLPWYLDFQQLDPELRYYFDRCDNVAYWGSLTKNYLKELAP